ncbi:MAG TPA: histidine triad nucleotide-binding protein [Pseudobacteroides sp.]|uniref:histidine triad nucleotide-binding protein n=1 Tax=Pseudobacteroides sp. TaxID=1968840 RepID=UPI002F9530A5
MSDCIFCKIINKEIPSTAVYENDKVYAFKDINPAAPVHVLIVPKQHISSMNEIDESTSSYLIDIHMAAKKIAADLGIKDTGYRLINNCGSDGGQTVFHLHYHLIGGKNLGPNLL